MSVRTSRMKIFKRVFNHPFPRVLEAGRPVGIRFLVLFSLAFIWGSAPTDAQDSAPSAGRVSTGVGVVEAYQELLRENLALREQISKLSSTADKARSENRRLNSTVKDLETRVVELAGLIRNLQAARDERKDPVEVARLEQQLQAHLAERSALQTELTQLKERIAVLQAEAVAPAERGPRIAPGSDLFRQIEQENAQLKTQLLELEAARRAVAEDKASRDEILAAKEAELAEMEQVLTASRVERKNVTKLVKHVRRMQEQIRELRGTIQEKDDAIRQKEREVAELETAVQREQQKMQNIKKLAVLMDRIDQERQVHRMSDTAKVELYRRTADEHYEAERYELAEREYLKALKVDPSVADVHYNLGVLYDQKLNDKNRAMVHYTAYVELNPNANDIELVRLWIHEAELALAEYSKVESDKSERLAELMGTLEPVGMDASLQQQRDYHCRQAGIYAENSEFKKAVKLYEKALELDPHQADVHYNLGVIYDDELQDNKKAVQHYRKYLELRPFAEDSDLVRSWMMDARIDS